jgi:glyceraldehyde 3-phosphate dehydrogenase
MSTRVAIHGFGRTGRQAFKAIRNRYRDELEIAAVGIEDMAERASAAHLLQYDSNYGRFGETVTVTDSELRVGEDRIPLVSSEHLSGLPWADLGVDIVIESTGVYEENRLAEGHLEAGANKVVITAPSETADIQIIYGVDHDKYDPRRHDIISAGSDTTNALAAVLWVLQAEFEVKNALMTAIRAYTNAQKLLDASDPDLRRARSAPTSIVPTTTRADKAIGKVFPEMAGRLGGYAVRVPVATVSILELTAELGGPDATDARLNAAFEKAAAGPLSGILGVSHEALVSTDFRKDTRSAVVDTGLTITIGPLVKVSAWYDNEFGYSSRVADIAAYLAREHEPRTNGRTG